MEKTRKHRTQEVPALANVCKHKLQVERLLKGLEHRYLQAGGLGLLGFWHCLVTRVPSGDSPDTLRCALSS